MRFANYHRWLFENQGRITGDDARAYAEQLVGGDDLRKALADRRLDKLVQRDCLIGERLSAGRLPAMFAADKRFVAIPEDDDTMILMLRQAFTDQP